MIIFKKIKISKYFGAMIIIFVILFSFVSTIIDISKRAGPFGIGLPSSLVKYTSKTENFTIVHPGSWPVYETPQGNHGDIEVFAIINPPGRSFPHMILAKKLFPGENLNDVAKWGVERAKLLSTENFIEISLESRTINNVTGYLHDYFFSAPGIFEERHYHCNDLYFLENSLGYDLSFCSEEEDWDEVNNIFFQMVESFSVK